MVALRDKTHEQLSNKFHEMSSKKKFSDYYTNHNGVRVMVSRKHRIAIIQMHLYDANGYAVNMYTGFQLESDDDKGLEIVAKKYGCEHKTSILNQVINQVY